MADQDRVNNLDADYFNGLSKTGFSSEVMEHYFNSVDIYSMTCENATLRAKITVLPFAKVPKVQLNIGTSVMFNRLECTSYGGFNRVNSNKFTFDSYSHEAAIDGSLVYNQKLSFLNLYGGFGTNLGYTFAWGLIVTGRYLVNTGATYTGTDGGEINTTDSIDFYERSQMKNSIHQRVFLHGGASVMFYKRLEFGLEIRRGVGYRFNIGNPLKFTNLFSAGFNLKWNLK